MTPQEKAKELVNRFILVNSESVELETGEYELLLSLSKEDAKQCALIAVDEVLQNVNPYRSTIGRGYLTDEEFYQEVKKEIEKL